MIGTLFILAIIIGNILSFWTVINLKDNGLDAKYFTGHFLNTRNILKLSIKTTDSILKRKYFLIGLSNIGIDVIFFVIFILFIRSLPSSNDTACNVFKEFKSKQFNAKVEEKYLDKHEHSYKTLILQETDSRFKNQDFVNDKSNFYNFVKVGDSLIKKSNEAAVMVRRKGINKVFMIEFGCKEM